MTTTTYLSDVPPDVRQRAQKVRLAAFDVDGVLTDGTLIYAPDGSESKVFNTQDGFGMKLLREHGVEVALVTARDSAAVVARARELGLRHVQQGQRDKLASLTHLCKALNIAMDAVAYVGDDLLDLACMERAALSVAVANAHPLVRARAHWITRSRGGDGAVREVCDLVLSAHGKLDAILQRHLGPH